jgi:hypothetical protein
MACAEKMRNAEDTNRGCAVAMCVCVKLCHEAEQDFHKKIVYHQTENFERSRSSWM